MLCTPNNPCGKVRTNSDEQYEAFRFDKRVHRPALAARFLGTCPARWRGRVHISRGYLRAFWELTTEGWRGLTHDVPGLPDGYSR